MPVARVVITAILKDPDGVHKFEMPIPYQNDEQLPILPRIAIALIKEQGGFIRPLSDDNLRVNVIPYERLKDADIEVIPQLVSTDTNVGAATQDAVNRGRMLSLIKGGKG